MHKRLWEIDEVFYCPISGICLSMQEQRRLLKRCGAKISNIEDYAVHVSMIEQMKQESPLTTQLEKILNRKYRQEIAAWKSLSGKEWMTFFEQQLAPETAGALLWFSAAHCVLSQWQIVTIYGKIHILQHEQFALQTAMLRQHQREKAAYNSLQEKYGILQTQCRDMRSELQQKERELLCQHHELHALKLENHELQAHALSEAKRAEYEGMQQRLCNVEEKLRLRAEAVDALRTENQHLRQQLQEQHRLLENMRGEFLKMLNTFKCAEASPGISCPNAALCNRRVLIVGGITKLRAFYEQMVTEMGGTFEYHDGVDSDGNSALSSSVKRCDVIICPVDVNSHAACLTVKKFCKKLRKPYYMLHSSSISTVHRTLTEVAARSS